MSDTVTFWQELTTAALLGTQRRAFQPALPGGKLGALLEAQPNPAGENPPDAEERFLRAVAFTSLHRRAGELPPTVSPTLPPACPPETLPRCSSLAGRYLERILSSGRAPLLAEWIELAAAHGQRIREEHLPLMFDQPRLLQGLRSKLLPVLGERGRWLAALNPDWSAYTYSMDEKTWHEGRRKERLAFLSDLRQRDPNRARELLASTWDQEAPLDRSAALQALKDGLSMADEPFLESVLDDRRKEVRQAAAGLLAHLPESRLVQRMTGRALRLLNLKSVLLVRATLEVSLPAECDEAMQRDGIEPRPLPGSQLGEKAWWLVQILSAVPPRTWAKAWGRRPGQILDLARKHEWEDVLIEGWTEAILRSEDGEWLDALMAYETRRGDPKRSFNLISRLPVALKDRVMVTMLRQNPSLSYEQPASILLATCKFTWSAELTRYVTSCICATLQKGDLQPWRWEILLREIGNYFHPEQLEASIERISAAQHRREKADPYANDLLAILQFRADMRKAFTAS